MRKIAFALVVFSAALFMGSAVLAQNSQSLSISPLTFELTANPGEKVSNVIKITNSNDFPVTVKIDIEDFSPTGELGQVVVTEPSENQTYSLAHWVSVDTNSFPLAPKETHAVTVIIDVPANAEPGGHYGSILASIADGGSAGGVGVASKVGSLLLLQVAGATRESLEIASMEVPAFSEYGPVIIASRFENKGTVHLKPRGFIAVQNMFGQETAKLNLDPKNVLPNSIRRIETALDRRWMWGKYLATLTAIYGSSNEPLSYTVSFWVIPWRVSLAVGIVLLVILIILYRARRRIFLALKILFKGEQGGRM